MVWFRGLRRRRGALLALAIYALVALFAPALHTHVGADAPAHCVACTANPVGEVVRTDTTLAALVESGFVIVAAPEVWQHVSAVRLPARAPPTQG